MNEKATKMKKEIRAIANYRALILSKYFMSICLTFSFFYVGSLGFSKSPLYILILLNVLPSLISHLLKEYSRKYNFIDSLIYEEPYILLNLRRKYQYSRLNYVSNSISFFFSLFLLSLWQYNYSTIELIPLYIIYLPVITIVGGIVTRYLTVFFYLLKLPYILSHNKL